ncbi:MAG: DUF5977 domain-containing protein [Chitinophagaceae bacterium]
MKLYYNVAKSQLYKKQGCDIGYAGTAISYNVPVGKYISPLSQALTDQMAQTEIDANGQAFANAQGIASCVIDATPVWIGTGLEQCKDGHKMVQVKDENPNSSSRNQTQWVDTGVDATCPFQQNNIRIENNTSNRVYLTFTNSASELFNTSANARSVNYILLSPGTYTIRFNGSGGNQVHTGGCSFSYRDIMPFVVNDVLVNSACTTVSISDNF